MLKYNLSCILLLALGLSTGLKAQDQGNAAPQQRNDGKVIQIEAQVLDVRAELPTVQIVDKRKKSDFDEVKVEKSFKSELSSQTEELKFRPAATRLIEPIDDREIESLLNKKRF